MIERRTLRVASLDFPLSKLQSLLRHRCPSPNARLRNRGAASRPLVAEAGLNTREVRDAAQQMNLVSASQNITVNVAHCQIRLHTHRVTYGSRTKDAEIVNRPAGIFCDSVVRDRVQRHERRPMNQLQTLSRW